MILRLHHKGARPPARVPHNNLLFLGNNHRPMISGTQTRPFSRIFEFDSEPDAQPGVHFFNNTGFYNPTASPRTSLFSVAGGFLEQTTFSVNGNASFEYPNDSLTG